MILMKVYIDIPKEAMELFPDEYMPSDMIRFTCSDVTNVDNYIDCVCEFLKGVAHEREETGKETKR